MKPCDLREPLYAHGFSWRKRGLLSSFLQRADIRFVARGHEVSAEGDLLLWGRAAVPNGVPSGARICRLEDGFVRSVGLGADLTRPVSWVLDEVGIYFDATGPSGLERLLTEMLVDPVMLECARAFRERLVAAGMTKYNLPSSPWQPARADRPVILVIGQVESDASLAWGGRDVRRNLDLLRGVREAHPHAWVVYKPHPDVVAGLRSRGQGEDETHLWCDECVLYGDLHQMLEHVDQVHVMTSLSGFEALLRGKVVHCHGLPFYAGYGLTHDRFALSRRGRVRTLDELVAIALLEYPIYVSRATRRPCQPMQALEELIEWRRQSGGALPWWRACLRPLLARP